jgi:hypothetical protein
MVICDNEVCGHRARRSQAPSRLRVAGQREGESSRVAESEPLIGNKPQGHQQGPDPTEKRFATVGEFISRLRRTYPK